MFKRRKKLVIAIVIAVVLIAGISYATRKPSTPQFITAKAEKVDLIQTVDATGSISSAEEIGLNFKTTGRIASIRVAVGDSVKQNQVLADLSAGNLQSEVSRAQASVRSAEADLEKLVTGATQEEIAVTKEEVANAVIQLDLAKSKLQNLIVSQQRTRDEYRSNGIQTLIDKKFVAQYALDTVFNDLLDQNATDLFKTTKTSAVVAARNDYTLAKNALDLAAASISTAQASNESSDILDALYALQSALNRISVCLQEALDAFSGGIVTSDYSTAAIETLKSNSSVQATAVASAKTNVLSAITDLTSGEQDLKKAFDDATFAVKTAEGTLSLAQAKLNLSIAKPQSYEIKQQQSKVAQAQASLQAALSNLADTLIVAPIEGTITAVDSKVGEQAFLSKPSISMIGNSKLEIHVDIPESDITKISLNDEVSITLDAFGPDLKFKGIVQSIEPAERFIEGVVYYRLTINFTDVSEEVKPGMTANITITTETKNGVIAIPARAVTATGDGVKKVRVLSSSGVAVEREVSTGLKGDGGLIEITNGLAEGELVVTGEQKK